MCRNCVGLMPLHLAVQHGYSEIVHLLVKEGCDVTARYPTSGSSPLHVAASRGCTRTARILVDEGGASVFNVDVKHRTPVSEAVLATV